MKGGYCFVNRQSERIPCGILRGQRAYLKMTNFLTVEDSLYRRVGTAGIFNGKRGLI